MSQNTPSIPFENYFFTESDVTALEMTVENYPSILQAISDDAEVGKITEFKASMVGGTPTIDFRLAGSAVLQTIAVGQVLVCRPLAGDKVVMPAADFAAQYTFLLDPSMSSTALRAKVAELTALNEQLTIANDAIKVVNAELSAANSELTLTNADLTAANEALTIANTEVAAARDAAIAERDELQALFDAKVLEVAALTAQVTDLEGQVAALTPQLEAANAEVARLTAELTVAQTAVGNLTTANQTLTDDLAAKSAELESTSEALIQAQTDLAAANGQVSILAAEKASLQNSLSESEAALTQAQAQVATLQENLATANAEIERLKELVKEPISLDDSSEESIVMADKSIRVTASAPITTAKTINAKSLEVNSVEFASTKFNALATDEVALVGISSSGTLEKAVSNAAFSVNTNGVVKITGADFAQAGYNCLEIGLGGTAPSSVLIEDVDFSNLDNNAISIFDQADGAEITIKNCRFAASAPYVLRYSNRSNVKSTINIVDCTVTSAAPVLAYSGFICFQDYINADPAAAATANRFGADKLTVNFVNVTGPNGKVVAPVDPATAYGSSTDTQLMYVFDQAIVPYTGNENRYPRVNFS